MNPTQGANALPLLPVLNPNAGPTLIKKINLPDAPPPVLAKINMGDPQFAGGAPPPFPQFQAIGQPSPPAVSLSNANRVDNSSAPVLQKINVEPQPLTPLQQNIAYDQRKLQMLRDKDGRPYGFTGAPPSAQNPHGLAPNHPGIGGKILHVLSVAGNIAGDIFAPSTMANIPGTELNREVQERGYTNRLNQEESQNTDEQEKDAQTGNIQAQTGHQQLADQYLPQTEGDQHDLNVAERGHIAAETNAITNPPISLTNAYAHAVNDAITRGINPKDDPIVQQLSGAMRDVQPGADKSPEAPKTVSIEKGGRPHVMAWDPKTSNYDLDQGESGEKPPVVNLNDGLKNQLALRSGVLKTYQPALDSAERFDVMAQNYEDAVKNHDQQAMLSLLANHLGMTMGLQKGARMNKDIIQEAQHSQPWLAGLKAKFSPDGYLSGVTLSPGQMRQMVDLGRHRFAEDIVKARSQAQYEGAKDDGPDRTPSPATINFYMAQAHGNLDQAKQLAAQDGWTVK